MGWGWEAEQPLCQDVGVAGTAVESGCRALGSRWAGLQLRSERAASEAARCGCTSQGPL